MIKEGSRKLEKLCGNGLTGTGIARRILLLTDRVFMALGLALTGLTQKENGKELWTVKNISWWDELELTKDRRFKKLDLGPDKLVYESVLPLEEIWKLHRKYKTKFLQVYQEDPLENPYRQDRIKQVDAVETKLKDPRLHFVNVWVFDWDY
jgi:hypothetical protein